MSSYQIIDPTSISYEQVKSDLTEYIQSLPDYSKWKDFYESGSGTTQTELLSGLGVYLSWHSMGARRESYLDTCRLYTSAINICNILGYPVNRVAAPRVKVKFFNPYATYWARETPMFYYKGYSLSLLHSQTVLYGDNELEFVMGDWKNISLTCPSNINFYNVLMLDTGIDNNDFGDSLELTVNGSPMPMVRYSDEMLPTNVLIKTYSGGILLIFGDGVLGYRARINDAISFNYVNTAGALGVLSIDPQDLTKNLPCTVNEVAVLVPGYHGDELAKMSVVAPGYLSSKRRMVTGTDHDFIFLSYSGSLISTSHAKDETECCTIYLCYLFDDEHFASLTERTSMYSFLDDFKVVGARLIIVDPIKVGVEVKLTAVVQEGVTQAEIEAEIRDVVNKYVMKLNTAFHVGAMTTDVAQVPGVLRVYLQRPVSDKTLTYRQYLKLVNVEVVVTSDLDYIAEVDPDNNGYWQFYKASTNTSVSSYKLIDTFGGFQITGSIVPGSLIANMSTNTKAYVVSVDSNSQLTLTRDIFGVVGQNYEAYSTNV